MNDNEWLDIMGNKFTKIGFPDMPRITGRRYINLGFNKTGTTTIGECFEILGLGPVADDNNTYEYVLPMFAYNDYGPALHIASKFRSFEDRPWNTHQMWRILDLIFDDKLFLLSIRDPEKWYNCAINWLTVTHKDSRVKKLSYLHHLNIESFNKKDMIDAYNKHNEDVQTYFAGRDDLLIMNVEEGDGWEKLCKFLDRPIPDVPFPHSNKQDPLYKK